MMRKVLSIFTILSLLLVPSLAFAQDVCDVPGSGDSVFCNEQDTSGGSATNNRVLEILNTVVRVLTTIAATIATITIIISGIMFTTAGGDPGKISRARSALIYSVVAVIVAVMARLIVIFVIGNV